MVLPPTANANDAAALADELARYRVVGAEQLTGLLAEFTGEGASAFVDLLVRRGALTPFQAALVLAGETVALALGPYRLTGHAGRGTFGPLFAATHVSQPGTFAVRVLPLRSLWKARQAKRLAGALAAGTVHPAVVPLTEVDSANGFHYLVWSRDDGVRLSDHVEASGPLPPGEAAALLGHLANALAACHTAGAVHGALTPSCVGLKPGAVPRLLEFGAGALLAQNLEADESLFDSMSAAFASAAVLAFAAPELAAAPLAPAPAADQYALAAVGYFALTGLHPYPHPTLAEQLRAKRNGPPPSVAVVSPEVPAELAAVLERMMAPAPADRFASLAEVEQRLAALSFSGPPPAPEPLPSESLRLSRPQKGGPGHSGTVSRGATGSETPRPPARDDSDASVTFDLPAATETWPSGPPQKPAAERADAPPAAPFAPRPEGPPALATVTPPPTPSRDSVMGNRLLGALNGGGADRPPPPPDPRLSASAPGQWHSPPSGPDTPAAAQETAPPVPPPQEPPAGSPVWKKLRRNILFWKAPCDTVQVTVHGPLAATPGQTVGLTIFLHTPDTVANVRTLSRAFQHDAEQIGTGYLSCEVPRTAPLAVHVSVANAGVSRTLMNFVWRGQPHKLGFDLHVPWESAEGLTPGLVSVGLDNVRVGKIEFWLNVLPRKA